MFFADNCFAMGFFQLGRKIEAAKGYSLAEIPVFSSLSPAEQRLIEKKARLIDSSVLIEKIIHRGTLLK